jgi:hypothetical protein
MSYFLFSSVTLAQARVQLLFKGSLPVAKLDSGLRQNDGLI